MARLLVVDPSTGEAETGATDRITQLWSGQTTVVRPALSGWHDCQTLHADLSGMIVLGSAASVRDPSDWRDRLIELLGPLLDGTRILPLLGICWGHQLIAQLAGARIGHVREDAAKLLGMRTITVCGDSPLFDADQFRAAISHAEMVCAPPAGYRLIATQQDCTVHGLQHQTRPIYTLQSHPELPFDALVRLGYDGAEDPQRVADGTAILGRFMDICAATG